MPSTYVPKPKPAKYLSNASLLQELTKSKNTFNSYLEPWHAEYDLIISPKHTKADYKLAVEDGFKGSMEDWLATQTAAAMITPELIEEARIKKSKPRGKPNIPLEDIKPESIVVRVMTYEHIPLDPDRVRKSRLTDQSYTRTTFPPYKHFILTSEGVQEVLRSHWIGGFDNGHFSMDHGRMTEKLGRMFVLLVERYGRRGNWRGYTYNDEMQSSSLLQLAQVGLQFDESKSDNPFAFYTATITNCFRRVLATENKGQKIRDDLLIMAGATPSYTRQTDDMLAQRAAMSKKL
jgi:hypothetical protein